MTKKLEYNKTPISTEKMKIIVLQQQYEAIRDKYIKLFEAKHEIFFDSWVGSIAFFGDVFYFDFDDIVMDINTNQPKGLIIKWLNDCIDNDPKRINYNSYCMGLRFEHLK